MATLKSKILDWAGMTIRCKNIIVGADRSGNTGNDVDTSAKLVGGSVVWTFPTGAPTAAGTGANSAGVSTGSVCSKVLPISVNGTVYYIGLNSSNA